MSGLTIRSNITIVDDVPAGGTTGQVLTKNSNNDFDIKWTTVGGTGTVTSVSAGIGLTASPNPITGGGEIDIANTGVSAGEYTNANIVVNAQGQITSASNGTGGGGSGTVTQVAVSGQNGIVVSGSPITSAGTFTLKLNNITPNNISTGIVSAATVNVTGDIQAATGRIIASAATLSGKLTGQAASFTALVSAKSGINTTTVSASTLNSSGDVQAAAGRVTASAATFTSKLTGQAASFSAVVSAKGGLAVNSSLSLPNNSVTNPFLASMGAVTMKANATTSAANAADVSFSTFLDAAVSAAQGDVIYRNATNWVRLAAGTSGNFLQTQGVSANPQWAPAAGGGTVTSVSAGRNLTASTNPITATGQIDLATNIKVSNISVSACAPAGFIVSNVSGALSSEVLTISKEFFLSTGANATFPLDTAAGFAYTINKVKGAQCSNGNITASINVLASAVTGLSAISITTNSSAADSTASGANAVAVGNRVTVVFTGNSAATNIEFTLVATRTS